MVGVQKIDDSAFLRLGISVADTYSDESAVDTWNSPSFNYGLVEFGCLDEALDINYIFSANGLFYKAGAISFVKV